MLRRLFTLTSAASLAMCVATCALWARSYQTGDAYIAQPSDCRQVGVVGRSGTLWLTTSAVTPGPNRTVGFTESPGYRGFPAGDPATDIWGTVGPGTLGFRHVSQVLPFGSYRLIGTPYWFVCLALATPPAVVLMRWWRRRLAA